MFEQSEVGCLVDDRGVAPIPPALPGVSPARDALDELASAPAPRWRETMPGPEMIRALADASLQTCTDSELLDVLAGWERVAAWVSAQQTRVLDRTRTRLLETAVREETDLDGNTPWEAVYRQVETEISTALRWTSRFTNIRLETAQQLSERLPNALDALAAGQLTYRHAEMVCDETATLTDQQARRIVERLLPEASTKTVGGLRRRLRKACLQVDPDTGKERAARAIGERSVTIRPLSDGLAQLEAIGPAEAVLAMFRTLDETADRHHKNDPRTQTARRFDALTDFVLTGGWVTTTGPVTTASSSETTDATGTAGNAGMRNAWCPPPPKIPILAQITTDMPTLLGLQDNPAELHGYGPLAANLARALAADAQWQRFIQDPITGAPQDLGRTRRHPDAEMRRWIIARDRTCLFPECYRPAADCEPDHNPAWEHGAGSDKDTLHQLCPKHHKVRHHGWRYQRHSDRITWTSPHDETYERYLTEADLINPTDACPHDEQEFDDAIRPIADEDQRISIWLREPRSRQNRRISEFQSPLDEIPLDVVDAFRLDDPTGPWSRDTYSDFDDWVPTPEEEQAILDAEDRLAWGECIDPKSIIGRALIEKARRRQRARQPWPDKPPF